MGITNKANEYIGYPQKVDEPCTITVQRQVYVDGYKQALEDVYEWLYKTGRGQMIGSLDRFLNIKED